VDDGSGNINRTYIIPSTTQTLTYCWDLCTACSTTTALTVTTAASATAITSNSASVAGNVSGTGITARGVCYASTQNPTLANSVASAGTGEGSFTANLSGLNPATLYYARAFAINANDTAFGAQISFTTLPGTPVQTVDVTYKVDVTNYIAAGNTIAANGIRIAGNFADRGARVNGTAMLNWNPTDAASAMTNSGNNIWSVTVTYPDSSVAKTQLYKFVNGNWGANEGGTGSAILTGQCGVDDGSGNINRTMVIPAASAIAAYCWDQCGSVCNTSSVLNSATDNLIYPNPFENRLMIKSTGNYSYRIASIDGKILMEGRLEPGNNEINTSRLPVGLLLLLRPGMPVWKIEKR
jgi:hypothetical protein